ncbi:MAG: methyltransferase domain-containing protein [bacterium]
MKNYYQKKLSSNRLKQVYDLAPARTRQYLDAELNHALNYITAGDIVLDLGCGYGRQFPLLCKKAGFVVGIDSSAESLALGHEYLMEFSNFLLIRMNARKLLFPDESFNVVLCLQNGISAFHVDQKKLIREAIRVTKRGGTVLFSSYFGKFWEDRLKWFQLQSEAGLLGKIDSEKTGNGNIVCEDGFTATTINEEKFKQLIQGVPGIHASMKEIDDSSLFLEISRW